MKTIMISVKPRYADLEMNGEKKIEIRKFYIEPPFKVVNYVTKGGENLIQWNDSAGADGYYSSAQCLHFKCRELCNRKITIGEELLNGKVAFEYVVNEITKITNKGFVNPEFLEKELFQKSCLSVEEFFKYSDNYKKDLYGLHISDLKIYDKPKELGEFNGYCKNKKECYADVVRHCNEIHLDWKCKPITRPPQNYVYVEVIE